MLGPLLLQVSQPNPRNPTLTIATGDGPAISEAMGMKNPGSAKVPCRFCNIRATYSPSYRHYYVPHEPSLRTKGLYTRVNTRQTIADVMAIGGDAPVEYGRWDIEAFSLLIYH